MDTLPWHKLARAERDHELDELMRWARLMDTELLLLRRPLYVAVVKLFVADDARGHGYARDVMGEVTTWADELGVSLGVTPSPHWGADVARLTAFYASLGFYTNPMPVGHFQIQEDLYRHPHGERGGLSGIVDGTAGAGVCPRA